MYAGPDGNPWSFGVWGSGWKFCVFIVSMHWDYAVQGSIFCSPCVGKIVLWGCVLGSPCSWKPLYSTVRMAAKPVNKQAVRAS